MKEFFFGALALLFLLLIVATAFYHAYGILRSVVLFFFRDRIARNMIFVSLNARSKKFLQKHFQYYNALPAKDKVVFEKRVQKFINMKEFVARGNLGAVSLEMKTLVSAAAVQLTFGLPYIYFRHFDRILIYPDDYYSTITRRYHKGEVNSKGIIVLSWKSLMEGYLDHTDGRNVGLHEMAHALKIVDAITNEEYDFFDYDAFHGFVRHGRAEMERILAGEESLFRSYAATNDHEFFAVAVENFFERPHDFRNRHSEIFNHLCNLLRQNPSRLVPVV